MGLFDMSKGDGVGFAKVKNQQGFTNADLLEKLSAVKVSFGTPEMGKVGKEEAVVYKKISSKFDVFCRIDGKNIIMGKIGTDGVSSADTAINMGLDLFLGHKDEETSQADHAVDALAAIVGKLNNGETVTESVQSASIKTSTGEEFEFYMTQKAISLKPELVGTINGQDLKITGDLMGCDFDICVGSLIIGHIDTTRTVWSDCYRIRVLDESYQDIMIALAIVCDNVVDSQDD